MAAKVTTAAGATWQEVAADRQKYRDETIAALEPALPDIKDVPLNTIPLAKEVLSPEEIKITESTVEDLAAQLAEGKISSVEVTKAFLRRAGLAQKAVRPYQPLQRVTADDSSDKLHHGTPPPTSPHPRCRPRHLPLHTQEANGALTRYPYQRERTYRDERSRSQCWVRSLGGRGR
jgi:amidase